MQILMRRFSSPRDAGVLRATRGFLGVSNDDRSRAAHKLITDSADRVHTLRYVHEDIAVELDGQVMPIEDLGRALGDVAGTITIDATTLNVADMLILFRLLLRAHGPRIVSAYVEPRAYTQPYSDDVIRRRDFELTEIRHKFTSVEGHFYRLVANSHDAVFFVGFESERLFQALEEHQIDPRRSNVVFGVPAFKVGWEMHSFANHINLVREHGIGSRVHFCPADNPLATFEFLERMRGNRRSSANRMFVAPLGTHTQALGTALFLSRHPDVGLLYDFPERTTQPSAGVGPAHLFEIRGS